MISQFFYKQYLAYRYSYFSIKKRVFTINSVRETYAEMSVCNEIHKFKLADNMSFEEGSALGVPYFTVKIVLLFIYFKLEA